MQNPVTQLLTSSSQLPLSSPCCLFKRGSLLLEIALVAFPSTPLRTEPPRVIALRAARELFREEGVSDIWGTPEAPLSHPLLNVKFKELQPKCVWKSNPLSN